MILTRIQQRFFSNSFTEIGNRFRSVYGEGSQRCASDSEVKPYPIIAYGLLIWDGGVYSDPIQIIHVGKLLFFILYKLDTWVASGTAEPDPKFDSQV